MIRVKSKRNLFLFLLFKISHFTARVDFEWNLFETIGGCGALKMLENKFEWFVYTRCSFFSDSLNGFTQQLLLFVFNLSFKYYHVQNEFVEHFEIFWFNKKTFYVAKLVINSIFFKLPTPYFFFDSIKVADSDTTSRQERLFSPFLSFFFLSLPFSLFK